MITIAVSLKSAVNTSMSLPMDNTRFIIDISILTPIPTCIKNRMRCPSFSITFLVIVIEATDDCIRVTSHEMAMSLSESRVSL